MYSTCSDVGAHRHIRRADRRERAKTPTNKPYLPVEDERPVVRSGEAGRRPHPVAVVLVHLSGRQPGRQPGKVHGKITVVQPDIRDGRQAGRGEDTEV